MPKVAAKGSNAADGGWLRIIKSLNACIVHVVGSHRASSRIHPGSKSSGHQHPPIAAIEMLMVTPNDGTESCAVAIEATTSASAAAAKEIPTVGMIKARGLRPSEIPNSAHPTANSNDHLRDPDDEPRE